MASRIRDAAACLCFFLVFGICCAGAADQPAPAAPASDLVGQWSLESVSFNGLTPSGATPKGDMLIDSAGHYSVVILNAGRAGNLSYYGTYGFDGVSKTATFRVLGSSRTRLEGHDMKRLVAVNGDEMTQSSQPGPRGGVIKTVWKRAK